MMSLTKVGFIIPLPLPYLIFVYYSHDNLARIILSLYLYLICRIIPGPCALIPHPMLLPSLELGSHSFIFIWYFLHRYVSLYHVYYV